MKAKKEIKEKLCRYLQRQLDALVVEAKEEIRKIKQSSTVEEIMEHKQHLLYTYVDFLPIGNQHCYFCFQFELQNSRYCRYACEKCNYATVHGICKKKNSDYQKLKDATIILMKAISKYYQGEEYNDKQ